MAANGVIHCLPGEVPEVYRTDEEQERKDRLLTVHTSADSETFSEKINASTGSSEFTEDDDDEDDEQKDDTNREIMYEPIFVRSIGGE